MSGTGEITITQERTKKALVCDFIANDGSVGYCSFQNHKHIVFKQIFSF